MLHLDIFSDPICPWCFIGKRRLERALAARPSLDVSVAWRAFQLNPAMPSEGMERGRYLAAKFGSTVEAQRLYTHIERVGAMEGIEFRFDRIAVTPNTIDAHRLIRFASRQGKGDAVVERLFEAYFIEGHHIGERTELTSLAAAAGLDGATVAAHLDSTEDIAEVRQEDIKGRQLGIEGVPCFILNQRYALSGAQEPEAFFSLFDMAAEESRRQTTSSWGNTPNSEP